MTAETLVVGGGVAGLIVARRLALGGRRVRVFEASETFGGQIGAHEVAGVRLDRAAESFATRGGTVRALIDELGIGDRVVAPTPSPAWLVRSGGRAAPLPSTGLLGIPADPTAADVRATIGDDGAAIAARDATLGPEVGADAMTLADLVRARMGEAVLTELVATVVRGVYSKEPTEVALDEAAPGIIAAMRAHGSLGAAVSAIRAAAPAGSAVLGLDGGIVTLVDALVADCERLGVQLEPGATVTDVTSDAVTVQQHGTLAAAREHGTVMLAASPRATSPHTPSGPPARRITLVTLALDAPHLTAAPRGTGVLVARDAGTAARALTHSSAKWPWLRSLAPDIEFVRLSFDDHPADAQDLALRDAPHLLGTALGTLRDAAVVQLERPVPASAPDGIVTTGEPVAGTGLARVVAHAERTAAGLLSGPRAPLAETRTARIRKDVPA